MTKAKTNIASSLINYLFRAVSTVFTLRRYFQIDPFHRNCSRRNEMMEAEETSRLYETVMFPELSMIKKRQKPGVWWGWNGRADACFCTKEWDKRGGRRRPTVCCVALRLAAFRDTNRPSASSRCRKQTKQYIYMRGKIERLEDGSLAESWTFGYFKDTVSFLLPHAYVTG